VKLKHKLMSGYAIALGVASLGTLNGIWLGNYHHQNALAIRNQATIEQNILNQLQIDVLYNRPGKQIAPYLQSPEEFRQETQAMIARLQDIQQALAAYNRSDQSQTILTDLPGLLRGYEATVDQVIVEVQAFVDATEPLVAEQSLPEAARQQLLDLARSPEFTAFIEFPNQLFPLNQQANEIEAIATLALEDAERLRTQVIVASLMVSIAISAILSWYISRSIAHPLSTVTQTAQQVTQNDNFDLRVMVNTDDEVGMLAIALNQLIFRVGRLLEQQRQSATLQELFQNEKMAILGRMVSEVAHEINNPVNFISGNLKHADRYINDIFELLRLYEAALSTPPPSIAAKADDIDRDFIETDLPKLITSMQTGATRAQQIARSLRNFSRLDNAKPVEVDLHTCLDDTLVILHGRFKQCIEIKQRYGTIPPVMGYAGPLYQVFSNVIGNAIDALLQAQPPDPCITITSCMRSSQVVVAIADNGPGIASDALPHIFDALFTTKPTGKGTGLGLAISRQIIEETHQGTLTCQSSVGDGTVFEIILPAMASSTERDHPWTACSESDTLAPMATDDSSAPETNVLKSR